MLIALTTEARGVSRLSADQKQLVDLTREDSLFCPPPCLGERGKAVWTLVGTLNTLRRIEGGAEVSPNCSAKSLTELFFRLLNV